MINPIIKTENFGLCPKCGERLVIFTAIYKARSLNPNGMPMGMEDQKNHLKMVCPKCKWQIPAKHTINGIRPKGFVETVDTPQEFYLGKGE